MQNKLLKKFGQLRKCTSGNALLMTALGLPACLGAIGYGVDTAQWYMWQRELQHSVDQAAIGGAWALAYEESGDYETRAGQEFTANQDVTSEFDAPPDISLSDYNGGSNNSVLVRATVTKRLPFFGMLLNRSTTVAARAQASFQEGNRYNACLITLKEDGTTFEVGGSAEVIANCGLGALSCSDDAIVIDGAATVETTSIATCGTVSASEELEDVITENATGLTDVYASVPIPEPTSSTPNQSYNCSGKGNNKIANLQPGVYTSIVVSCNTTFNKGIYFIDGGTLDLSHNAPVVGNGVMFVLRNGATIKLGGQGSQGGINLSPMQQSDLESTPYADDARRLAGMLILEDKGTETSPSQHTINGNTNLNLQGVVYLPNGDLTINGDSGSITDLCFQVSAYTLKISGNAYLRTLCDYDSSSELGSSAPRVRLIA